MVGVGRQHSRRGRDGSSQQTQSEPERGTTSGRVEMEVVVVVVAVVVVVVVPST